MNESLYEKLLNSAFRFVSYRPRSEKEIRDFLTDKLKRWKIFGGTVVQKAVDRLTELGYVDDAKFARWWVEQRQTFKPKGMKLITLELKKKGVERRVIEEICQSTHDRELNDNIISEKELARKSIQKKLPSWASLPLLARKQKIYRFLGSRGFDGETISHVIDEVTEKE